MSYPIRLFVSTGILGAALLVASTTTPVLSQTAPAEIASTEAPPSVSITEVNPALLANGYRASRLIGSNVVNENNETVGTVDELIISPAAGTPFFVISVGGFFGIGARHVVISSASVDLQGQRILVPGATTDALNNLPVFDYSK